MSNPMSCLCRRVRTATAAALVAVVAIGGAALPSARRAEASSPVTPAVFTAPLAITNTYFPFTPGAVKVLTGRDGRDRLTDVDLYSETTRDFVLGAATVRCRVLYEMAFTDGGLVEISRNHFAQADDGTVYYFGEVVEIYQDGAIVSHDGSWLVGGPGAGDPAETMTVTAPAVFMPANPEPGDVYQPEAVPGGPQETDTIRRVARTVKVPAGKYTGCIEVLEVTSDARETKWYAPGVGVIRAKTGAELSRLESSTLRAK